MDSASALHLLGPVFDFLLKLLVKFLLLTSFNCLFEQGVGDLEGCTGLPTL